MNRQKGFTLIELLVVIAIIGLLSTLAVVSLNSARSKARDARRTSDIRQVQTALEIYYNDQAAYPSQAAAVLPLGVTGSSVTLSSTNGWAASAAGTTYMSQVPSDPVAANAYNYQINNTSTGDYAICFTLENARTEWGTGLACKAKPGSINCAAACSGL
ncbi:type II secretion system protein [Patescibacteria group bacterium]|nr:type II secretion system protein [Patescibacteria group bacterium]